MQIYYHFLESPVGPFFVAGTQTTLHVTAFADSAHSWGHKPGWIKDSQPLKYATEPLARYFAGEPVIFDMPLAPKGTDFQQRVWTALQDIPYGQTKSYGDIANMLGNPGASRAVGGANNANPIPIIIPCHRVIGADGSMTGFGGGMETKIKLLELEGIPVPAEQLSLFS